MQDPKPNGQPTEFETEKAKLDDAVEKLKCINRRRIDQAESIARMARGSRPDMKAVKPEMAKKPTPEEEDMNDDLTAKFRALRSAS